MSHRPLNILLTKRADSDEESIYNYIATTFGNIYADRFRSKIIELFNKLAFTPTAGRLVTNSQALRVFIFNRQCKVVYKATEIDLIIVRILRSKQNLAATY